MMDDEGEDEEDDIEGSFSDFYVYVQSTTTKMCIRDHGDFSNNNSNIKE